MKKKFNCKHFGAHLKQARKDLSLTQTQATKLIGVSQGNISDFESGNSEPMASTIVSFSKTYGISGDWLLGVSDKK
jgi:transcriptional regulator with XRE-family HTH domain